MGFYFRVRYVVVLNDVDGRPLPENIGVHIQVERGHDIMINDN